MKLSFASIVAVAGSASVVLATLSIPGIVSLDLGTNGGGLKLSVLGGLIQANIGGHTSSGKRTGLRGALPSIPPVAF
ncbi:hypothetical protein H4R19_004581 [Coemansia spiralis]|nr:hypothetical protein H4R19_004581 [Coemansia spiralis]